MGHTTPPAPPQTTGSAPASLPTPLARPGSAFSVQPVLADLPPLHCPCLLTGPAPCSHPSLGAGDRRGQPPEEHMQPLLPPPPPPPPHTPRPPPTCDMPPVGRLLPAMLAWSPPAPPPFSLMPIMAMWPSLMRPSGLTSYASSWSACRPPGRPAGHQGGGPGLHASRQSDAGLGGDLHTRVPLVRGCCWRRGARGWGQAQHTSAPVGDLGRPPPPTKNTHEDGTRPRQPSNPNTRGIAPRRPRGGAKPSRHYILVGASAHNSKSSARCLSGTPAGLAAGHPSPVRGTTASARYASSAPPPVGRRSAPPGASRQGGHERGRGAGSVSRVVLVCKRGWVRERGHQGCDRAHGVPTRAAT